MQGIVARVKEHHRCMGCTAWVALHGLHCMGLHCMGCTAWGCTAWSCTAWGCTAWVADMGLYCIYGVALHEAALHGLYLFGGGGGGGGGNPIETRLSN